MDARQATSTATTPGTELYALVRAGFIAKGTSLHQWCKRHQQAHSNVRAALLGKWNGPKADDLRRKIVDEIGNS